MTVSLGGVTPHRLTSRPGSLPLSRAAFLVTNPTRNSVQTAMIE